MNLQGRASDVPKLKAVVDSLDGLPEGLSSFYTQGQDGRYYLDAEGVDALPQVRGLASKKDELLAEKKALAEQLGQYEGLDPEEYQKLLEEKEERERKAAKEKGDVEALLEAERRKMQKVVDQAKKEAEEATESLSTLRRNVALQTARADAAAAIGKQGNFTLLWPHIRDRIQPVDGDEPGYRFVDDDGVEEPVENMEAFVGGLREQDQFADAFYADAPSGSGASGTTRNSQGNVRSINRNDPSAWADAAEGIAAGEVAVNG